MRDHPTDADLIEQIASLLCAEIALLDANYTLDIIGILMRRPAEAWRDPELHRDLADWYDIVVHHGTAKQREDRER